MSARHPRPASGPQPPHHDRPSTGPNPLRRASDRVESWIRAFLLLVLALGLPMAAVSAGLAAYDSSMRTVQTESTDRRQVTARLTSDAKGFTADGKEQANVRWTDPEGKVRTGSISVEPGTHAGAGVRVWVDRDGRITGRPMNALDARAAGWIVGGIAAAGVTTGFFAARVTTSFLLDRRRYAQWDAEWDLVEPQWSARFRR